MEGSEIEWRRSRFADAVVMMLWSYVIVSITIFALVTSDIMAALSILGVLIVGIIVAMINLYHVDPYLIGIADDRMIFRHRIRFRRPRYREVPWQEISRLEFERRKGAGKRLYTDEGVRLLNIPDETADKIERLWKKAKDDLGNAPGNGS